MKQQDHLLKTRLGFWSLTATAVGSVIGSGWLFGAMYAAQAAGPESLISWVIGGIAMLLVALVFAELAMVKPESGGLVRYPKYTNGSMVASLAGWAMWLGFVANPPTEAAGVVQYASQFHVFAGLYNKAHSQLTLAGILIAILLMIVFVLLNYFGVHIFAKSNTFITIIKFIVPSLTLIALLASGFHSANLTSHGGFAPNGWGAGLSCIATSGIIFAYTGFRNPIDLGGEAKNPKRNIPAALIASIIISIVLYIGLEFAFIGTVPTAMLAHGWHGIQFNSPFANLAMALNLTWLYWTLMADSMISPSGSAIVYTATNARNIFGLAKNRFAPRFFEQIHPKFGVPTRALILNFIVGLIYLFPLKSWHDIISITGDLAVFTFSAGPISLMVFRRIGLTGKDQRIVGMRIIAPLGFVVSSLIVFWTPWQKLRVTAFIMLLGLIVYLITYFVKKEDKKEIFGGLWMIIYFVVLYAISGLGAFQGADVIKEPWGSIIVALMSFLVYFWGIRSGVRYMEATDQPELTARENTSAQVNADVLNL